MFYQFNLLVDCKHDLFALCDSLDSLKREGYLVNFFTEAPVVFDHGFIEFEAMTEAGLLHCILDTGATWNFLNKDLENEHNEATFIANKKNENLLFSNPENKDLLNFDFKETKMISSFKIGENEFGPLTFNYIRSPIPIDVILGMEFFHSHLVFIDFGNQKVYFYAYPEDPEEI